MNRNFKRRNRKLLNRLIWKQRTLRKTWGFRREIREKISIHPEMEYKFQLDASYAKASRSFLNTYFPGYKNLDWHYAYSFVNGIQSPNYIPEDLYFTKIEPGLNSRLLAKSSTDKNSYGLLHPKDQMPKTYLRTIGGQYFDGDYSLISEMEAKDKLSKIPGKCVLKPALNSGKFLQIFNGPLFGEHTKYFLNLAKKNRWMYDFHNDTYFNFYG